MWKLTLWVLGFKCDRKWYVVNNVRSQSQTITFACDSATVFTYARWSAHAELVKHLFLWQRSYLCIFKMAKAYKTKGYETENFNIKESRNGKIWLVVEKWSPYINSVSKNTLLGPDNVLKEYIRTHILLNVTSWTWHILIYIL